MRVCVVSEEMCYHSEYGNKEFFLGKKIIAQE
jgi:hypothetical protein